jgi:2'-5' RNA ligase
MPNEKHFPATSSVPSKRRKKESSNHNQRQQRRNYRPGYNSYLKVQLDDHTITTLHSYAVQIQNRLQGLEEGATAADSSVPDVPQPQQQKNNLKFKPRSKQSLHMTLFFGGETLCEIPAMELIDWHTRIAERLSRSGFVTLQRQQVPGNNDVSTKPTAMATHDTDKDKEGNQQDYSFQVKGLKVFPPRRNNLVVAILAPRTVEADVIATDNGWDELYQDIRRISSDESCSKGLAETCKATSNGKWVAHITLGNIYGGKKQTNPEVINPILDDIFQGGCVDTDRNLAEDENDQELLSTGTTSKHGAWYAYCQGIEMGGPIPQQVELDWNFIYIGK